MTISVRFYNSVEDMERDVNVAGGEAGFRFATYGEDPERAGNAAVSLVRDCFIGESGNFSLGDFGF